MENKNVDFDRVNFFLKEIYNSKEPCYLPSLLQVHGISHKILKQVKKMEVIKEVNENGKRWVYNKDLPKPDEFREFRRLIYAILGDDNYKKDDGLYYDSYQAARLIGVPASKLRSFRKAWDVPHEKIASKLRYPIKEYDNWVKTNYFLNKVNEKQDGLFKETELDKCIIKDENNNIYMKRDHLSISESQYKKLAREFGENETTETIYKVLNYKNNKKYSSLYLTAFNWLRRDRDGITIVKNDNHKTEKCQSNKKEVDITISESEFQPVTVSLKFNTRESLKRFIDENNVSGSEIIEKLTSKL